MSGVRLHYFSDIHIEKNPLPISDIPVTQSDAIVLAGDIDSGFLNNSSFCQELAQIHQKPVFYTLGNNCVYQRNLQDVRRLWCESNLDSVLYLDDDISHSFKGFTFSGCMLWPLYQGMSHQDIKKNDAIRMGKIKKNLYGTNNNPLNAFDLIKNTLTSIASLEKILEMHDKNIVITHFAPSWKSQFEFFPKDEAQGPHASDLEELMSNYDISAWIHGHLHHEFTYSVGETDIYCNPIPGRRNISSKLNKVIELA